jgi:hypothetical protein
MKASVVAWLAAVALAGGCATQGVRSLVPGKSTAQEIERTMGSPAQKLPAQGGATVWYYPRGWDTYALTVGPDGIMRGTEQRLTAENVRRIVPGKTAKPEVLELLGPARRVSRLPLKPREVWEYQYIDIADKWQLWVQFSDDGVVREVLQEPHPEGNSAWNLP